MSSEFTYLKDFLVKVHTTATVKSWTDTRDITWADDSKIYIYPPEIMGVNLDVFKKRYNVLLEETTQVKLSTALNNILDGIIKLNKRTAITSYTRPGTLLWGQFISSTQAEEEGLNKRWSQTIVLEFEWGTS